MILALIPQFGLGVVSCYFADTYGNLAVSATSTPIEGNGCDPKS
jgi:hypothetical protein